MAIEQLISPGALQRRVPVSSGLRDSILQHRKEIENILDRDDDRLLLIVDISSTDSREQLLQFAKQIAPLALSINDNIFLAVQVCGRHTLAQTQGMTDSELSVEQRITRTRELMREVANLGLPVASPILDMLEPQYLQDFLSWSEIGPSVTESQVHRQLASGLSIPVGLKKGNGGSIQSMINALGAITNPHTFLGFGSDGIATILQSSGNRHAHVVLPGSEGNVDYGLSDIDQLQTSLLENDYIPNIMVDCSGNNSIEKMETQLQIFEYLVEKNISGNPNLIGMMLDWAGGIGDEVSPSWPILSDYLNDLSNRLMQR